MAEPATGGNLGALLGAQTVERLIRAGQGRDKLTIATQMNQLQKYFGPLRNDIKPGAYDEYAVTSYQLPDAYRGRNVFLRETVIGLVTTGNEWYTTLALPWAHTNEHHFTWTEWKFNMTLAGEVPAEGISRLVTSSQRQFARHTMRRGLAFMLEHGFWQTEQGQEQYRRNMLGIRASIQETQNYDVSFEIANARNYWKEWQRQKGMLNVSYKKLMDMETQYFAIVNKSARSFDLMMSNLLRAADSLGVRPNLLIAPTDFRMYYAHVDPEKTSKLRLLWCGVVYCDVSFYSRSLFRFLLLRAAYWSFGPDGIAVLKRGPDAVTSVFNMVVVETRRLDISDQEPPVEPFLNLATYGEYYKLMDAYRGESHACFTMSWMTTALWDEARNGEFVKITFGQAFRHVMRFDDETHVPRAEHVRLAEKSSEKARQQATSGQMYPGYHPMLVGRGLTAGQQKARYDKVFRDVFLYWNDANEFDVVTHFGLMETLAASKETFRDVAFTAAQVAYPCQALEDAKNVLNRLLDLIDKSEKMPYNAHWELELQRVNYPQQMQNGLFTGQPTEEKAAQHRGLPRIAEVAPNRWGGMSLPKKSAHPSFAEYYSPPGTNNGPALRTLADQVGKNTGWDEAAQIASDGLIVLDHIVNTMATVMSTSLFIDADNRPPWFPLPESLTTLMHEVFVGPRDAVFMRFMPALWGVPARGARPAPADRVGTNANDAVRATFTSPSDAVKVLLQSSPPLLAAYTTILTELGVRARVATTAGNEADAAQLRKFETDVTRLILAVALENLPDMPPAQRGSFPAETCRDAACRARNMVRQLFSAWRDARPQYFTNVMRTLEPLYNTVDQPQAQAVSRADQALMRMLAAKNMPTVVLAARQPQLGAIGPPDSSSDVPVLAIADAATFNAYAFTPAAGTRDYVALLASVEQLESLMRQAMPYVLLPNWRTLPAPAPAQEQGGAQAAPAVVPVPAVSTLDVLQAFRDNVDATEADEVQPAGQAIKQQFDAMYDAAGGRAGLETLLPSLLVDNEPGVRDTDNINIAITADAWRAGVWVRAPRNAYRVWTETALQEEWPLALPSNPSTAHLSPVGDRSNVLTEKELDRLLARPQYRASVKSQNLEDLSALSSFEAMERWKVPEDVWTSAAPSLRESLAAASRGRKRAAEDKQQQQQQDDDDDDGGDRDRDRERARERDRGGSRPGSMGPPKTVPRRGRTTTNAQAMMTGLLSAPDIQDYLAHQQGSDEQRLRAIERRDAQPMDRRREFDDFKRVHMQRYDRADMETIGGGRGDAAVDRAREYGRFESTYNQLRKHLHQSVFVQRWKDGNTTADLITRMFHQVLLGCLNSETQWEDFIANNVMPPAGILLFRLWITRRMHNVPVMVGGLETGATMYGNVSVLLGDDVRFLEVFV